MTNIQLLHKRCTYTDNLFLFYRYKFSYGKIQKSRRITKISYGKIILIKQYKLIDKVISGNYPIICRRHKR